MPLSAEQVLFHGEWGLNANVRGIDAELATGTAINDY
jgi:hypothetical protein